MHARGNLLDPFYRALRKQKSIPGFIFIDFTLTSYKSKIDKPKDKSQSKVQAQAKS